MKTTKFTRLALMMAFVLAFSTSTSFAEQPVDVIPAEVLGEMSYDLHNIHQMSNSFDKVRLFTDMAAEFHKNELVAEAESMFNQSSLLASHLVKRGDRAKAHFYIASKLQELGDEKRAVGMISVGMYEAHQIFHNDKLKTSLFLEGAEIFAKMGEVEIARSISEQARKFYTENN